MMSETKARKLAAENGIQISKRVTVGSVSTFTVGAQTVSWDREKGGSACWAVNGERAGFLGEAIAKAVQVELY